MFVNTKEHEVKRPTEEMAPRQQDFTDTVPQLNNTGSRKITYTLMEAVYTEFAPKSPIQRDSSLA